MYKIASYSYTYKYNAYSKKNRLIALVLFITLDL